VHWPNSDEEPAAKSVILNKFTAAKRDAICLVREREAEVGAGVWMWWTDRLRLDEGRVGAATVCNHGDPWKAFHSILGTGQLEVYDAVL